MKKVLKIFLILIILSTFLINFSVFATNTTTENTTRNTTIQNSDNTSNNSEKNNEDEVQTISNENETSTQVTSVAAINEGALSVSDILNILLIATNIVIILLAIAILIKLK